EGHARPSRGKRGPRKEIARAGRAIEHSDRSRERKSSSPRGEALARATTACADSTRGRRRRARRRRERGPPVAGGARQLAVEAADDVEVEVEALLVDALLAAALSLDDDLLPVASDVSALVALEDGLEPLSPLLA